MAELVGIFGASHAPPLYRNWAKLAADATNGLARGYAELGSALTAARIDVLLMIGADHFANFFLNNFPSFCVGVGEEHGGPPEPWLADRSNIEVRGHPVFAQYLVRDLLHSGFDPSISYSVKLDHSFCLPLWQAGLEEFPRIVPLFINAIEEPLPTLARCFAWGQAIADAIGRLPEPLRVAILASGGLSHSVGEPTMGQVDEEFDRGFIELMSHGPIEPILEFAERLLPRTGNGTQEIRYWLAAHGAARARGFRLINYSALPEAFTGCAIARWDLTGVSQPERVR